MSPYILLAIISAKLLAFHEIVFLDGFDADISNKISNACKYVSADKNALYTLKLPERDTFKYKAISTRVNVSLQKDFILFARRMDFRQIVSFLESNALNIQT